MKKKLVIKKKGLRGEEGFKTISIRIKYETVEKLNELAEKTNRTRNGLINTLWTSVKLKKIKKSLTIRE